MFNELYGAERNRTSKHKVMDMNIPHEFTKGGIIRVCKQKFREEWELPRDVVDGIETNGGGLTCIHLLTDSVNDVLGHAPDGMAILKSVFLKLDRQMRHEIVKHYRGFGYDWVDVVCLNRTMWKIFLFRNTNAPLPPTLMMSERACFD